MSTTPMKPEAKRALSQTIRGLRTRLLDDLHAATEREYRLSVRARDAGLDEATRTRRERLESWVAEQSRMERQLKGGKAARSPEDFRREAEKRAAYTLLNRLVLIRLMEEPRPQAHSAHSADGASGADWPRGPEIPPLRSPAVVTGGWESRAYQDFRQLAPAICQSGRHDETEGYAFLLRLVFEELATELPGLFGPGGVADLIPVPPATLRAVIDALNTKELTSCWADDMTLGWIYQYWNDPEREGLDTKLSGGGKIEPHEIASKTQMFTERYMVDWLLQNSLGPMWLAMCQKHGWTAEVLTPGADGLSTFDRLEARRVAWREQRQQNQVDLTALMPLHTELERRWAYYVPQPIPADAIDKAPTSLRDLKLLDPAVGSGHFLVVALGLLLPLYREEARHRGLTSDPAWSDTAIVEHIVAHNLHGVDLDERAVQIAAAALWLEARHLAKDARPPRVNLVASNLKLSRLGAEDPALVELRREVERETGIPKKLTDTLIQALEGADHLGTLLKVDQAIDQAIDAWEREVLTRTTPVQLTLDGNAPARQAQIDFERLRVRRDVHQALEVFLAKHTSADDLGLRLRGEQLAAGVRFVRMVREGTYDLVVANPPYQGTTKMADSRYVERTYPLGKADLYAAFLLRGLELVREGGVSAMLTMRNWMFIKQFGALRAHLLANHGLRALGDFDRGAFEDVPDEVVSVTISVFGRAMSTRSSVAQCPSPRDDSTRDAERTRRKRGATLCHEGRHTFDPAALKVVPEWPLVYWWDKAMLKAYRSAPLIGRSSPARQGLSPADSGRFVRRPWEVVRRTPDWEMFIKGAEGRAWLEPANEIVRWRAAGLEMRNFERAVIRNPELYFRLGVAFSMIGSTFSARAHRFPSVFADMGSSIFPERIGEALCAMNSSRARYVLSSLNPGVHFQGGDVNRLPLFPIADADTIFAKVESAFALHESHREPSVEFRRPGPSPWRHAQDWAQAAVDRPDGAPLPDYVEVLDPAPPTDHLSFALGVALGRFGPAGSGHEGILDPHKADHQAVLNQALPYGLLFLDLTLADHDDRDGLGHPATAPLRDAWREHGPAVAPKRSLREWLALDYFKDLHKGLYESRPIHWPLSSANKTFVVWLTIHRMTEQTLRVALADHLLPTLKRIEGELNDLRAAKDGPDKAAARTADRRYDKVLKAKDELAAFITLVEQCADRGAPPTDTKCPPREVDKRYAPDLDDGVMINSAALWPLLEPQWKDPKKWWKELAESRGRKDYDWSHLAMRHWPTRVDTKCQSDPSLAVAHGCFWRYHPARAWAWELRLQDEIGPEFRITEAPYEPFGQVPLSAWSGRAGDPLSSGKLGDPGDKEHRKAFLRDHPETALAAIGKEAIRRMGRGTKRKLVNGLRLLEPGLWTHQPEKLWELELTLSERQGQELRIQAPDEPDARSAFEAQHPERVTDRQSRLASLVPSADLFGPDDADPQDDVDDVEDEPAMEDDE